MDIAVLDISSGKILSVWTADRYTRSPVNRLAIDRHLGRENQCKQPPQLEPWLRQPMDGRGGPGGERCEQESAQAIM